MKIPRRSPRRAQRREAPRTQRPAQLLPGASDAAMSASMLLVRKMLTASAVADYRLRWPFTSSSLFFGPALRLKPLRLRSRLFTPPASVYVPSVGNFVVSINFFSVLRISINF
jgi:hypothetical protein